MTKWSTVPQPKDPVARVREGPGSRVRLLWGGKRGNVRGDDHGDLVSSDGINADYLRLPGGELVVDTRRAIAYAIIDEAKTLGHAPSRSSLQRIAELNAEWTAKVESGGRPGRQLKRELGVLRGELAKVEEAAREVDQSDRRRSRKRERGSR